jgi:superfamily I DNA and/or RNA helicase/ribosomal protein S27AE
MVKEAIRGEIWLCPRCGITMDLIDDNKTILKCPRCGYVEAVPSLQQKKVSECPRCGRPLISRDSYNLRFKFCPNYHYVIIEPIKSNRYLPINVDEVCKWLKEELDIAKRSGRVIGYVEEVVNQWGGAGLQAEVKAKILVNYVNTLLPGSVISIGNKPCKIQEIQDIRSQDIKNEKYTEEYIEVRLNVFTKEPLSGKEYLISITEPTIIYEAALEIMGCKETTSENEDNAENKKPRPSCTLYGIVTPAYKCAEDCNYEYYKYYKGRRKIALCGTCESKNHGFNKNEQKPCFYIHLLPEPDRDYEGYTKIRDIKLYDDQRRAIDSILNLWLSPLYFTIFNNKIYVNTQQIVPPGFLVIEGPPGTGKTTVIAIAACALARAGYKVLITSHTNVAIDNALEKIVSLCPDLKNEVIRVGPPFNISEKLQHFMVNPKALSIILDKKIVGMTIAELAVLHKKYNLENYAKNIKRWPLFDYVFIDEASMVPLGIAIIPIHYGLRRVILGDTRQLPPITRSQQPTRAAESILQLLVDDGRAPVVKLRIQRRGVKEIFDYISKVFYQGELKTESSIEPICFKEAKYGDAIDKALIGDGANICNQDRQKRKPIIWIDVGGTTEWIRLEDIYGAPSAINRDEACLAAAIYMRLYEYLKYQYQNIADRVAIISTHRAQSILIERVIERLGLDKPAIAYLVAAGGGKNSKEIIYVKDIESLLDLRVSKTVDSYQGREKDIIIYSMTADRYHKALANYARFNVAISRAKRMLIILSSMGENDLKKLPWIYLLTKTVYTHRVRIDRNAVGNNDVCKKIDEIANVLKIFGS